MKANSEAINTIDTRESSTSPKVNCLEGKRCPKCGSYGPFEIVATVRILLHDDGTDNAEDGTTEYGDGAPTTCGVCQYEGTFGDFELSAAPYFLPLIATRAKLGS